jgi:hypothetical protein
MNRRHFLKNTASLLALNGLTQLMPAISFALQSQDQYLVIFELDGGADVSLGLDPWTSEQRPLDTDYFLEYTHGDLVQVGNVLYGPAMNDIRNVLSDFSVVRGVFLAESDNGHAAAEAMMKSGNGSGKFPDLAIEFAAMHEDDDNFGVLTSSSLNQLDRNVNQQQIGALGSLQSGSFNSPLGRGGALGNARQDLVRKSEQISRFTKLRDQLIGSDYNNYQLREQASIVAALATGVSRSVNYKGQSQNGGLDTHSNHVGTHMNTQAQYWKQLGDLIKILKSVPTADGQTIFDKTTIVAFSEFARTPALNAAKGKDHNPLTNSVLVSGPGFKKGTAVGGSRIVNRRISSTGLPYHVAVPCDLNTGRVATRREEFSMGDIITPEMIMATVADGMGLSRNMFGCARPSTKSVKAILK